MAVVRRLIQVLLCSIIIDNSESYGYMRRGPRFNRGNRYPVTQGDPYKRSPYSGSPYSGSPYPGRPYPGIPYPGIPYPGIPSQNMPSNSWEVGEIDLNHVTIQRQMMYRSPQWNPYFSRSGIPIIKSPSKELNVFDPKKLDTPSDAKNEAVSQYRKQIMSYYYFPSKGSSGVYMRSGVTILCLNLEKLSQSKSSPSKVMNAFRQDFENVVEEDINSFTNGGVFVTQENRSTYDSSVNDLGDDLEDKLMSLSNRSELLRFKDAETLSISIIRTNPYMRMLLSRSNETRLSSAESLAIASITEGIVKKSNLLDSVEGDRRKLYFHTRKKRKRGGILMKVISRYLETGELKDKEVSSLVACVLMSALGKKFDECVKEKDSSSNDSN